MRFVHLNDRDEIECCLRRNPYLHIYSLGDLDDFFWPKTTWYGWRGDGTLQEVVLLYAGQAPPTLLAISESPQVMGELLRSVQPELPECFYAHLSPGLEEVLGRSHDLDCHGGHYKMSLLATDAVQAVDEAGVERLSTDDLDAIVEFYRESYPGNWFDARMLETRQYFGINDDEGLASVAGIHVYSRPYRVAALGNIATRPACRNRGLGRRVTARLCRSLLEDVDHIGLNVKADNRAAIACYQRLGFGVTAKYGEFTARRKP